MNWAEAAVLLTAVPSPLRWCRFDNDTLHCHLDSLHDTLHAQKLLNHSNCAALISTHFHNLVAEIPPALATPMHMAAIVDEASASVTFLYKLVQGCRCPQFHHVHSVCVIYQLSFCTQRSIFWSALRRCRWAATVGHFRCGSMADAHSPNSVEFYTTK